MSHALCQTHLSQVISTALMLMDSAPRVRICTILNSRHKVNTFKGSPGTATNSIRLWSMRVWLLCLFPSQLERANATAIAILNPCGIIEREQGLSHARFVAWNPSVKDNCKFCLHVCLQAMFADRILGSGLRKGEEYCVSIPGYKPTYSTTATTSKTKAPSI
jgi:hypothetical protein